jgi:hypothetical protein
MPTIQSKTFKVLLGPVLLVSSLTIYIYSFRVTAAILLLTLFACYIRFLFTSKTTLLRLVFVAFLIAAFLPVDISFQNYPGPPRFVRLVMGLPGPELARREQRGEVMLGGCIVRGTEPRWVLVW